MNTQSENMKALVEMLLDTEHLVGRENDRVYIDDKGVERFGDNAPTYVLTLQELITN